MENARFVALVSHVQQFKVHRNQFFTDIYQFVVVTAQMPRTRDLAIFMTTTTDNGQTKPITLSLAHARGVNMAGQVA